mmetsp:Transcript_54864/g.139035  ORF Transcript_54864/g.139035 Transcript_54864/m.139035 type:complete len:218 (+) Transcript_54864:975-1628(+)
MEGLCAIVEGSREGGDGCVPFHEIQEPLLREARLFVQAVAADDRHQGTAARADRVDHEADHLEGMALVAFLEHLRARHALQDVPGLVQVTAVAQPDPHEEAPDLGFVDHRAANIDDLLNCHCAVLVPAELASQDFWEAAHKWATDRQILQGRTPNVKRIATPHHAQKGAEGLGETGLLPELELQLLRQEGPHVARERLCLREVRERSRHCSRVGKNA